jgi:hypothetical protein
MLAALVVLLRSPELLVGRRPGRRRSAGLLPFAVGLGVIANNLVSTATFASAPTTA